MKILIALLLFFALANPLPAQQTMSLDAKRDIDISRKMINDKRNTAIAYNMTFTQQEKEKFWPLYREYREAMWAVGDKRVAVLVDYAENIDVMTDKLAKKLLDRSFAVEKEMISTKQKYAGKFGRILPATKVARLMQIENRMDAMVDLKIAEGVPLME
jgi:hypothetical protein